MFEGSLPEGDNDTQCSTLSAPGKRSATIHWVSVYPFKLCCDGGDQLGRQK